MEYKLSMCTKCYSFAVYETPVYETLVTLSHSVLTL